LKEQTITLWRTNLGKRYGHVVRQTPQFVIQFGEYVATFQKQSCLHGQAVDGSCEYTVYKLEFRFCVILNPFLQFWMCRPGVSARRRKYITTKQIKLNRGTIQ